MPEIECQRCGQIEQRATLVPGTRLLQCSDCVKELWDPADAPKPKKPTGFHRGWKFMKEFVHENGTVYHKGEEQPKLKGTLPPTPKKITEKDTRSKAQKARDKQEVFVGINKLKKQIKKEKRVTHRRKLETQLKKLTKQL
tara:strand:- start:711 stop:1130 length:420 start_codon:yes stop_codon:yes gene_type:complete